jgi:hypothetical protein
MALERLQSQSDGALMTFTNEEASRSNSSLPVIYGVVLRSHGMLSISRSILEWFYLYL